MGAADPQAGVDRAPEDLPGRNLRLDRLGVALACLAALAAVASRGWLPGWCLGVCAGVALLSTAALPLLARWSPTQPDAFKLALFTLALSPPLTALVWGAWHLTLGAADALAATAASFALLHLFSLGRSVRIAPGSRGERAILVLAVALCVGVGLLLLRGNEPRLGETGVLRAALAMSVDRSLPPQHPWLAGEAWGQAWAADVLAACCTRALGLAPSVVHALFACWALLLTPLLLFQIAASIWCDSKRSALSAALAVIAGLLIRGGSPTGHAALESFLSPGPTAPALMLSLAGLACAAHALRPGGRPWVGLCGLFHGSALLLDFPSAWPAALATLLAALSPLCDASARPRVLLAVLLGALPGLAQMRLLEPASLPMSFDDASLGVRLGSWLVPLLLALLGLAYAWRAILPARRVVLFLCALGGVIAGLAAFMHNKWTNPECAWSLALFGLTMPCVALFPTGDDALRARGFRRWRGVAVFLAFGLGGLLVLAERCWSAWPAAGRDDALLGETAGALEPISSEASAVDLRAALACLRQDSRLREDHAVLLACPVHNPYRTTRDLPPLALAACAGLALYGDEGQRLLEREPQYLPRLEELLRLFRHPGEFDPQLFARLEHAGAQAVIALVRDEDRAVNPALVGKLERMGFARWRDFGGVGLFVGPRAAARRYVETP